MGETILILGGARSGKSRLALDLATERPPVTFVATAIVGQDDPSLALRVQRHRDQRPADWTTVEVGWDIEGLLVGLGITGGSVLVDCVTLWLSQAILGLADGIPREDSDVLATLERAAIAGASGPSRLIWVSNEVGSGVVPENALARRFIDLQGLANQKLAAICDKVVLCVAGLPLVIKSR